jgi:hypothetical protein
MAQCTRCGAETQLHVRNMPLCPECNGATEKAGPGNSFKDSEPLARSASAGGGDDPA